MTSPIWIAVIGAVATLGAGAGFWSVLTLGATKRKLIAEAKLSEANTAALLSQSAREWIERLEQRVQAAEAEADGLRRAAHAARGEVDELRQAVADLTAVLRRWRQAVLDPRMSRDELREMVTAEQRGDRNGRPGG